MTGRLSSVDQGIGTITTCSLPATNTVFASGVTAMSAGIVSSASEP